MLYTLADTAVGATTSHTLWATVITSSSASQPALLLHMSALDCCHTAVASMTWHTIFLPLLHPAKGMLWMLVLLLHPAKGMLWMLVLLLMRLLRRSCRSLQG
jgi:hypothetical protein